MNKRIFFSLILLLVSHSTYCQEINTSSSGTFTDSRDGHEYSWIKIGKQIWMAENLTYLPSVSPSLNGSEIDPYYYVYGYEGDSVNEAKKTENYLTYGVLYNWKAALKACPSGWHLPSSEEFGDLRKYVSNKKGNKSMRNPGFTLKETGFSLWFKSDKIKGTSKSLGFNALPAGGRGMLFPNLPKEEIEKYKENMDKSIFFGLGYTTFFWSSTKKFTIKNGNGIGFSYLSNGISLLFGKEKWGGISVRCLKDKD